MDEPLEEESNIEDIENIFQNLNVNKMDYKYHTGFIGSERHYYPRPTPQDILFEENNQYSHASYSGSQVYYWNIDGLNEYQILSVIHQIMMYATACQTIGNPEKNIALIIICGFLGSLNGWWNNYLTMAQKQEILTVVKHEVNEAG